MVLYKYLREAWKKPSEAGSELYRSRLIQWRTEPATVRIERPTRLDRARALGYKAKQGFVLVRQQVSRGSHVRPTIKGGRRPKTSRQRMILNMNYRTIAEQRAAKHYPNCEVLNSYYVAEDGQRYWFEIILVDKSHPAIKANPQLNWVTSGTNKGRVYRGLTASARISRGLKYKGEASKQFRPSKAAVYRRKMSRQAYK